MSPVLWYTTPCSPLKVNRPTKYPTVQVYISPSQFITLNENIKQISECLTRMETQRELIRITAAAVIAVQDKQEQRHCIIPHTADGVFSHPFIA
jgi:hypothetical protein